MHLNAFLNNEQPSTPEHRLTQHYACADYKGHSRRMHRVTVLNDRIGG